MLFDAETVMAAQLVVARRMPIMWSDFLSPTPQSRREMDLMVTEKILAAGKSSAVLPGALMTAAFATVGACGRGVPMPFAAYSGLGDLIKTVLSPTTRTVKDNAKRLA